MMKKPSKKRNDGAYKARKGGAKNKATEAFKEEEKGRFDPKDKGSNRADKEDDVFVIVGKNPVLEALRSDQGIDKLLVLKDNTDHTMKRIRDQAKRKNIIVQSTDKAKLEYLADGQVHQGVAALMAPFPYSSLEDVLALAAKKGRDPFVVILDHLTDPHNLGAIIRSANLCGADGVIIPKRRSASLTAVSVKASSGAVSHTPIVKVNNLSQTLDELKKKGFWIAGADTQGKNYYEADYRGAMAVVIGNEGSGLSDSVKKQCDFFVTIPIYGEIESFNASAAAAIILSEAAKQRHQWKPY